VGWSQIIFGAVLVLVLLVVAVLYGVRQVLTLRRLRGAEEMPSEERDHLHQRAWRRLLMSLLLLLLGGMLTAALVYLEAPAQRLADQREAQEQQGDFSPLSPEQRPFARFYLSFWLVFLLILMAVVLLAALDLWSIRRYGLRQHRKLIADRRAMIEREVARLRQERNGHH
jgi:ABC-type Fe3+ transport system permease subunit